MMRISMSLPRKLLKDFDEVINDRGYNSRSKGIRDALKDYIVRYKWMNQMEGEYIGTLSIVYNPQYGGVLEDLNNVKQSYQEYINASMNFNIKEKRILEVIIVKGDIKQIQSLNEKIMRLKGVEHIKLTATATEGIKKS